MDALLTGTFYLAVSAATSVSAPAAVEAASDPSPAVAVPAAVPAASYVIVDIPAFNRARRPLSATEIEAADEPAEAAAPDVAPAMHGAAAAPLAGHETGAGLNDAVVAAHDVRIALLKQRIEDVAHDGAAASALARDLDLRLKRALAARDLAVARAGGEPRAVAGPHAIAPPAQAGRVAQVERAAKPLVTRVAAAPQPAARPTPATIEAIHRPEPLAQARQHLADARTALAPLPAAPAIVASAPPATRADPPEFQLSFWQAPVAEFGMAIAALLIVLAMGQMLWPVPAANTPRHPLPA